MNSKIYSLPFLRTIPFLFFFTPSKNNLYRHGNIIVLSIFTLFGLNILGDYISIREGHYFLTWGIPTLACKVFSLAIFYYLFCQNEGKSDSAVFLYSISIEIWIICLALSIFFHTTITRMLSIEVDYFYFQGFEIVLQITAIGAFLYRVANRNLYVLKNYLLSYSAIVILPFVFFNFLSVYFWTGDFDEEYDDYFYIENYDQLFDNQANLIGMQGELLAKGDQDKKEIYFLGFASYESQSVFRNEVEYIKSLVANEFAMPNHSMNLINSRETLDSHPLATGGNIKKALSVIESKMDIDDDILFLYLTSHGSSDHQLSVSFYPLSLTNLNPQMLAGYLESTNIKWKVIVISACYSGGFVDLLKDDNNIVVTAADATSTSFGCADNREFTYFGEAVFKDNFSPDKNLIETFEHAIKQVSIREAEQALKPSNPQLWVGKNIKDHLSNK